MPLKSDAQAIVRPRTLRLLGPELVDMVLSKETRPLATTGDLWLRAAGSA